MDDTEGKVDDEWQKVNDKRKCALFARTHLPENVYVDFLNACPLSGHINYNSC